MTETIDSAARDDRRPPREERRRPRLRIHRAWLVAAVTFVTIIGGAAFTLVFPPLLVTTLVASVLSVSFIIIDAESVWLEGAALLGL